MKLQYTYLLICWLVPAAIAAQEFDLIIKSGHVIDPKNQVDQVMDVAVADGVIQQVAPEIDPARGKKIIDASGLLVTPGLIDIHTHVFVGEANRFAGGFSSVSPDDFTFKSGITTVVDAGTSGWRSFPSFKELVIDRSQTRVLAFLNITGAGMVGAPEEENLEDMTVQSAVEIIKKYPDIIVGIKLGHYRGTQWDPFTLAQAAATEADVPMLLECHVPELPLDQLLTRMQPGDIFTHTYGAVNDRDWILDDNFDIKPEVLAARSKGIYFDVGHGGGSFHYNLAVPALDQGFYPDSFGTDLHRFSMNAGMKDMLNVMSKFLNLGMPLNMLIDRATWNPAQMIHREDLGNLSQGSEADIAVLGIREGTFGYVDSGGNKIEGNKKLEAELTLRKGKVVWDLNGLAAQIYK